MCETTQIHTLKSLFKNSAFLLFYMLLYYSFLLGPSVAVAYREGVAISWRCSKKVLLYNHSLLILDFVNQFCSSILQMPLREGSIAILSCLFICVFPNGCPQVTRKRFLANVKPTGNIYYFNIIHISCYWYFDILKWQNFFQHKTLEIGIQRGHHTIISVSCKGVF